jgi:hypothetical protein
MAIHVKVPNNVDFYRTGLSIVANNGVGPAAVHAANSIYFSLSTHPEMADADPDAKGVTTRLLEYFAKFPFDRQDANALSNLAIFQCLWGDYQSALKNVDKGIALFEVEENPRFITEVSGGGPFYPIIIKWELYLTKARVLVLLHKPEKQKSLLR